MGSEYRQFNFPQHHARGEVLTGSTGPEPVLPIQPEKLSMCSCVHGVSQAHVNTKLEHSFPHLADLFWIPLDSAAIPITQVKIKLYFAT